MSAAPAVLSLRDVSVRFGTVQALDAVSFDLRRGEVIALVGANGSGKTTLLRVLHGLVRHRGERIVDARLAQAMVFQRPFMLRLSVRRNLSIALWLGGVPRAEWPQRSAQALQRVGLAGLDERPARRLSGGQQQRLALARAWALRPDLLFLDEPTASLDPSAKKEVEALLEGFAADGMTLVLSTHNLGQAKRLATRVVYLEAGRVEADLPAWQFFGTDLAGRAQLFVKGEMTWTLE